jgi:hypothetical protein
MHREQIEFNVTPPVWLGESAWFWPTIAATVARACFDVLSKLV